MSKIIGLTGGIGSGKTTIANYLQSKGIPIYIADDEARKISTSPKVVQKIVELFGNQILTDNILDRRKLGQIVFNNPTELEKLNNLIHPLVKKDFKQWIENHKDSQVLIKESAILFESNAYKNCDYIITVTAPKAIKIARVMQRDNCTKAAVLSRMKSQLSDKEKIAKSDFVIKNDTIENAKLQADAIIKKLENLVKNQ